jgi:hypothetical protein
MAQNRTRGVQLIIRVTEEEKALIREKMRLLHTDSISAYIRKMAIDGYIINVDYSEIKNHAVFHMKHGFHCEISANLTRVTVEERALI